MTLNLELPTDLRDALTQTAARRGQTLAEAAAEDLRLLHPPDAPTRERLAVALYHARLVPQGDAAALAGLSRAAFLDALGRHGVPPIRYDAAEAFEDAARVAAWEADTAPPDTVSPDTIAPDAPPPAGR